MLIKFIILNFFILSLAKVISGENTIAQKLMLKLFSFVQIATESVQIPNESPILKEYQPFKFLAEKDGKNFGGLLAKKLWKHESFEEFIKFELNEEEGIQKIVEETKMKMDNEYILIENRNSIKGILNVLERYKSKLVKKGESSKNVLTINYTMNLLYHGYEKAGEKLNERQEKVRLIFTAIEDLEKIYRELYENIGEIQRLLKIIGELGPEEKRHALKSVQNDFHLKKQTIMKEIAHEKSELAENIKNNRQNFTKLEVEFSDFNCALNRVGLVDGISREMAPKLALGGKQALEEFLGRKVENVIEENLIVEIAQLFNEYYISFDREKV